MKSITTKYLSGLCLTKPKLQNVYTYVYVRICICICMCVKRNLIIVLSQKIKKYKHEMNEISHDKIFLKRTLSHKTKTLQNLYVYIRTNMLYMYEKCIFYR